MKHELAITCRACGVMALAMLRALFTSWAGLLVVGSFILATIPLIAPRDPSEFHHAIARWCMGVMIAAFCWFIADFLGGAKKASDLGDRFQGLPFHPTLWHPVMSLILWGLASIWILSVALIFGHRASLLIPNALITILLPLPLLAGLSALNWKWPRLPCDSDSESRRFEAFLFTFLTMALVLLFLSTPLDLITRMARGLMEFGSDGRNDPPSGGTLTGWLIIGGICYLALKMRDLTWVDVHPLRAVHVGPSSRSLFWLLIWVVALPVGYTWFLELQGTPPHLLGMKIVTVPLFVVTVALVCKSFPLTLSASPQGLTLPIDVHRQLRRGLMIGLAWSAVALGAALMTTMLLKVMIQPTSFLSFRECLNISLCAFAMGLIVPMILFIPEQPLSGFRLLLVLGLIIFCPVLLLMVFMSDPGPEYVVITTVFIAYQIGSFLYLRATGDYSPSRQGIML